jgi:hypothetical protein
VNQRHNKVANIGFWLLVLAYCLMLISAWPNLNPSAEICVKVQKVRERYSRHLEVTRGISIWPHPSGEEVNLYPNGECDSIS